MSDGKPVRPRKHLASTDSVPLVEPTITAVHGCILIIDHHDTARRDIAEQFRLRGWNAITARDIRSGIELALAHQPRAIMSELTLPDAVGYHFARTLRTTVDHDIHLVAVTSLPEATFEKALAAGFDRVFAKPVNVEDVHRLLLL